MFIVVNLYVISSKVTIENSPLLDALICNGISFIYFFPSFEYCLLLKGMLTLPMFPQEYIVVLIFIVYLGS
jgi:hypothetical protein